MIKGYKAFNKDMTCRGFQFEEGQTYTHDGKLKLCQGGFHFCENSLDTLDYYNLCDSEIAEIEATGEDDKEGNKSATNSIKIGLKLGLKGFIDAAFSFVWERCKAGTKAASGDSSQLAASGDSSKLAASGDSSKLAASGDCSKLAASGDYSQLAASGDSSQLAVDGSSSVGAAIGINNKIKAKLGSWIALAEWKWDENKYIPLCVKSAQIDGVLLKEDLWYRLVNGEFVEDGQEGR